MYNIDIITTRLDIITFRYSSTFVIDFHSIFVIGNKILLLYENKNFAFDLVKYKIAIEHNHANECRKEKIFQIKVKNENNELIKEINVDILVYLVFVDIISTKMLNTNAYKVLLQNSYLLEEQNLLSDSIYLDILCRPVEIFLLTRNKIIFLSYGITTVKNMDSQMTSRIFMHFNRLSLEYIYSNVDNIFVVNLKFTKDYQNPGRLSLFEKNGELIYYFQCVCCTNTNNTVKHVNDDNLMNVELRKDTIIKKRKKDQ